MMTKNIPATNGRIKKPYRPFIFALALVLVFTLGAAQSFAKNGGNERYSGGYSGGYSGPGPSLTTVEQAKAMSDDAWVALKGHIVRNIGGKRYEFKDASGIVTVEIGGKRWQGQNIGPDDLVEIQGKIDKKFTTMEIDVKQIIKQ